MITRLSETVSGRVLKPAFSASRTITKLVVELSAAEHITGGDLEDLKAYPYSLPRGRGLFVRPWQRHKNKGAVVRFADGYHGLFLWDGDAKDMFHWGPAPRPRRRR